MEKFHSIIELLAESTNSKLTWQGDVAYAIERDKVGLPSSKVWRKVFTFDGKNVTVKCRGVSRIIPLADLERRFA